MTGDLLERIRGWRCPTHLARDPFVELSDLLTGKATKYRDDSTGAEWVRWHNLVWMIETKISRVR